VSILIVDDNTVSLKIVELNLKKHRYEILTATTGKEALECMSKNTDIQLVITDIMMPEMDGLSLLKQMKEHPVLKEIPVIMCTALKEMETVMKAIQLGCKHYIVKPIIPSQLLQKVKEVLGHDKPVLQNKRQVMRRLNLDTSAYGEIAREFAVSVAKKIALLEAYQNGDSQKDISSELLELMESTSLLGAHKVEKILERIAAKKEGVEDKVENGEYALLLRELKLLLEELPDVQSQGDTGINDKPVENDVVEENESVDKEVLQQENEHTDAVEQAATS
jgi:CheY-like chemotaxis protein